MALCPYANLGITWPVSEERIIATEVHRLLVASSLLLLSACAWMAPDYARPQQPPETALYPQTLAAATQAGLDATVTDWPDYFTDPQLQTLIRQALANNRDLRTSVLRMEEARAIYGIQRADQFPTLGANVSGNRALVPGDLNLSGQPQYSSQYQVAIGINAWELDFWGRVASLKEAALQNYLASTEAGRAATLSLITQVADAYAGLCEMNERIALAQATISTRADSYRIFHRRVEVGATSRFDLTQVRALLTQAQSLGAQLEQTRAAQMHAMVQLLGAEPAVDLASARCTAEMTLPALAAGLPSALLNARPDIIAAEHRLMAANANIGAARAAFFPRITLTGALGTASAELGGLFEDGSRAWSFTPQLSLPIFDAGRNINNLDLAEVRKEIAVAAYEKTVQTAFREVADALAAQQWLAQQLRFLQESRAAQAERARLAKLRYDNGSTAYLEVLDAQRDLLAAEQLTVQTQRALLSSRINLYAALGGGVGAPDRKKP